MVMEIAAWRRWWWRRSGLSRCASTPVDQQTTDAPTSTTSNMVYESDFYTTRRPYSRPTLTSYSVTTPRHYVVTDTPQRDRRAEEQYSYSYSSQAESSRPSSSVPSRTYSSSSERVVRSSGSGPGSSYNYTTERSSRSGDYPGSYHSSYSSTTSGRLPHGTTYRHFSYRV